jgi:glycosyltransferase involved in cell wall biosynthesis
MTLAVTGHRDSRHPTVLVLLPDASSGGGVRVVGELVREWSEMGISVRSLSLSVSSATGNEILRHAPHESFSGNQPFKHLISLRRLLRDAQPPYDIVFAIGDYCAFMAHTARRTLPPCIRPQVVNGVHQPRPFVSAIATSRRSRAVRWMGIRAVRAAVNGFDGYVFLSDEQMRVYSHLGVDSGVPQMVIPNPVRFGPADPRCLEDRVARLRQGGTVRLITVGSLNDLKNHLRLVETLTHLDSRFVLSVVGSGENDSLLRRRVDALNLHERVDFLGRREDVDELLDLHDVFVLSSDMEASPLVFLEALVRGLPVVSTDCAPVCRELADRHPSFVVSPTNDAFGLATAVQHITGDPSLTSHLARTATMILDGHSPRECAERHMNFFRQIQMLRLAAAEPGRAER